MWCPVMSEYSNSEVTYLSFGIGKDATWSIMDTFHSALQRPYNVICFQTDCSNCEAVYFDEP